MPHFVSNELLDSSTCVHIYSGIDRDALALQSAQVLTRAGYELKEGKPGSGVFVKGNRVMRILFGAFYKYFRFALIIEDGPNGTLKLRIQKQTSGMSGGLIGVAQVKKEMKRVAEDMKQI